jgi:protein kinase A
MKVLKKHRLIELRQVEHSINERNILARLDHPFIVRLLCTFQDANNLYMIMEYVVGGELFSVLRRAQRFPNDIAKFYAAEVILALEYLHSFNIIYRDLKPENLLVDKDGHIKMTDFGFAKFVPSTTKTLCGTPEYLAPEIIRSQDYGRAVDWYSLGVLIYEMLAGFPPFYHENNALLYEAVLEGHIRYPSHFDPKAMDLIQKLCTSDVAQRYGAMKNGAEDIKSHPWFVGVDWQKLYNRRIRPPYIPNVSGHGDTRYFETYAEEKEPYGKEGSDHYGDLFKFF